MAFRSFINNPTDELISYSEHSSHINNLRKARSTVDSKRPKRFSPKATKISGKKLFYMK